MKTGEIHENDFLYYSSVFNNFLPLLTFNGTKKSNSYISQKK